MQNDKKTIGEVLLENRTILLIGEINQSSAANVIAQLLYLESDSPGVDVNLYINSPGGSVDDTLAIVDTMNFISSPVHTICMGKAMSGGSVILASGAKGHRYILPNAQVMLHQPLSGVTGQCSDIVIQSNQLDLIKSNLNKIMANLTGQPIEKITKDLDRDYYLSAQDALAYGIVDKVIEKREIKKK